MSDKKNIAICLLSVLVLLLALRSGSSVNAAPGIIPSVSEVAVSSMETVPERVVSFMADVPAKISEVVENVPSKAPELIDPLKTTVPAVEMDTKILPLDEAIFQEQELPIPLAPHLLSKEDIVHAQSVVGLDKGSTVEIVENIGEENNMEENIPI
jgi:hypothetical protein